MRRRRSAATRERNLGANTETGAALVEFAVVLPVLCVFLFGIIEFGVGLNDYQSLRQGAREGARQAVVQQYGTTSGSCTTVTAPDEVKKVICLTKDRIGLPDVRVQVRYFAGTETGDDGTVRVCAQRRVAPLTGMIPAIDGIVLKTKIDMRMEDAIASEISTSTTYAEAAPTGGSWSWC